MPSLDKLVPINQTAISPELSHFNWTRETFSESVSSFQRRPKEIVGKVSKFTETTYF